MLLYYFIIIKSQWLLKSYMKHWIPQDGLYLSGKLSTLERCLTLFHFWPWFGSRKAFVPHCFGTGGLSVHLFHFLWFYLQGMLDLRLLSFGDFYFMMLFLNEVLWRRLFQVCFLLFYELHNFQNIKFNLL